jgi:hypothetical protein
MVHQLDEICLLGFSLNRLLFTVSSPPGFYIPENSPFNSSRCWGAQVTGESSKWALKVLDGPSITCDSFHLWDLLTRAMQSISTLIFGKSALTVHGLAPFVQTLMLFDGSCERQHIADSRDVNQEVDSILRLLCGPTEHLHAPYFATELSSFSLIYRISPP